MPGRKSILSNDSGGHSGPQHASSGDLENPQPSSHSAGGRRFSANSSKFVFYSLRLIESIYWKILTNLFTLVLLFGSPIQNLWLPKSADPVFDVLYTIAIVLFAVDLIIRLIVLPDYFLCFGRYLPQHGKDRHHQHHQSMFVGDARHYFMGSFNFWCDVLSISTLFFEISYINTINFDKVKVDITMDDFGVPSNLHSSFNRSYPVAFNLDILVVIAKTARVARLVRSASVVEISSWVNVYWYYERLNPFYYYRNWRENKRRMASEQEAQKHGQDMQPRAQSGVAPFGGLDMAAMAAAKARQSREARARKKSNPMMQALQGWTKAVGLNTNDKNLELRRTIAATKIQRAWRRRRNRPSVAVDPSLDNSRNQYGDEDSYWKNRPGGKLWGRFGGHSSRSRSKRPSEDSDKPPSAQVKKDEVRPESQVGSAMGELTGQRIAIGILISLVMTSLFTYGQFDASPGATICMLHGQTLKTSNPDYVTLALYAARNSSAGDMFYFESSPAGTDESIEFEFPVGENVDDLRDREQLQVTVTNAIGTTVGMFSIREEREKQALVELLSLIFVLLVWFVGVTAFAGPVMTLVIIPIERMIRLLGMLMVDPLGYQRTAKFKKFLFEEELLVKNSQWTKEVLKGMETSFLMSTILRIGSLMQVGFGSAGVDIIRNNLESGKSNNTLILNSQGSTVSCIFLFCDIRQFTDATECLQEEVFVFTNRIAEVVHSICHAYGGSANKNVGDAFLVSWRLEDDNNAGGRFSQTTPSLLAKHNQADKCMLSVVKICMALQYDDYYVDTMSQHARNSLLEKLKKRPGPIVQMGFGLHAGKAVQGAIGSQRKIDATYVSEAVERAEYLESSTKKYGLKMLMSGTFHGLLHQSNRRRCRKIDRVMFINDDAFGDDDDMMETGDIMELYTYDMDVEALWRKKSKGHDDSFSEPDPIGMGSPMNRQFSSRASGQSNKKQRNRRKSMLSFGDTGGRSEELKQPSFSADSGVSAAISAVNIPADMKSSAFFAGDKTDEAAGPGDLMLPTGPLVYNPNVWLQDDMRQIRHRYTTIVFQKFQQGLDAYYSRDWETARQCFEAVLERFPDGPSKYFISLMKKNDWTPPRGFQPYGIA